MSRLQVGGALGHLVEEGLAHYEIDPEMPQGWKVVVYEDDMPAIRRCEPALAAWMEPDAAERAEE